MNKDDFQKIEFDGTDILLKSLDFTNAKLRTDGSGLWSNVSKDVRILGVVFDGFITSDDNRPIINMDVYFNTEDWDVQEDGLIYTDKQFLAQLRYLLTQVFKIPEEIANEVYYSEQGMQEWNYVNFDLGDKLENMLVDIAKEYNAS